MMLHTFINIFVLIIAIIVLAISMYFVYKLMELNDMLEHISVSLIKFLKEYRTHHDV